MYFIVSFSFISASVNSEAKECCVGALREYSSYYLPFLLPTTSIQTFIPIFVCFFLTLIKISQLILLDTAIVGQKTCLYHIFCAVVVQVSICYSD